MILNLAHLNKIFAKNFDDESEKNLARKSIFLKAKGEENNGYFKKLNKEMGYHRDWMRSYDSSQKMELLQRKDSTSNTKFSSSLTPSGQTPLNNLKANGIGIIQMQHRYSTESLIKNKPPKAPKLLNLEPNYTCKLMSSIFEQKANKNI